MPKWQCTAVFCNLHFDWRGKKVWSGNWREIKNMKERKTVFVCFLLRNQVKSVMRTPKNKAKKFFRFSILKEAKSFLFRLISLWSDFFQNRCTRVVTDAVYCKLQCSPCCSTSASQGDTLHSSWRDQAQISGVPQGQVPARVKVG
jgi:hypothetical protein